MKQHIHIIGICGTFMGGLAAIAREAGFQVTGCDAHVYPPMSTQLAELGIDIVEGFDAEQLEQYPADIFIIGNVAKRGQPVVEAILNRGLPYTSGPQWLAENILSQYWVLAVAGTHGKTTTASMLAWILEYAGLAPGFLIGGIAENFGISARLAKPTRLDKQNTSPFFVIEADEYDTAFFDKRSKFVHYHPRTCILNNLEFDHADIFPDLAAIQNQFHHLVRTIPSEGLIVCNGSEKSLQAVLDKGCWTSVERFGIEAEWEAVATDSINHFHIFKKHQYQGQVHWSLLGKHNQRNALAAILAARHVGVDIQTACEALSSFKNVKRRMEVKGVVRDITIYDDFAHHPTAIATTIHGLRQKVGSQRIIAVIEPRSNTMKMGTLKAELAHSLSEADLVFCYHKGIDWDINAALDSLGNKVKSFDDAESLISAIVQVAAPQDHILIMSNGSFFNIHHKILQALDA